MAKFEANLRKIHIWLDVFKAHWLGQIYFQVLVFVSL